MAAGSWVFDAESSLPFAALTHTFVQCRYNLKSVLFWTPFVAMHLTLLKAKIHRATVTQAELHYEGSIAIDGRLLDISGIREYEQVHVFNVSNGKRFITYVIRAEAGSGTISVNGAAAHRATPGDLVIIAAYAQLAEAEAERFQPTLVYVDEHNGLTHTHRSIPQQAA